MIPEFDEIPIFYFTNHHLWRRYWINLIRQFLNLNILYRPKNTCITSRQLYCRFHDYEWSICKMNAMKEMIANQDFSSTFGPYLVAKWVKSYGFITWGDGYNLSLCKWYSGFRDNLSNMNWTFAQIIEKVNTNVIFPSNIINQTCGTTAFRIEYFKNTDNQWLKPGDENKIDKLGSFK